MANLISLSRLVAGVCLLVAALFGSARLCLILLGYALISDAIDGRLARSLGTVSERGARLDSTADCIIYLTMPIVALLLFPWLRANETTTCLLVFVGYAVPIMYGFIKYGRLTSYHTTAARISGVLLSTTFFILLATRVAWPFRIAVGVLLVSALEEVAMTRVLHQWRADVPSLRVAMQDRRVQQNAGCASAISQ